MDNKPRNVGTAFLLGAAAGWLVSVLMPERMKNKAKDEIRDKADLVKRIATDPQERQRVMDIFNQKTDQAMKQYRRARETLSEKVSNVKGAIAGIDEGKYKDAVGQTVESLRNEGGFTEEQLKKIKNYFESDYRNLMQSTQKNQGG